MVEKATKQNRGHHEEKDEKLYQKQVSKVTLDFVSGNLLDIKKTNSASQVKSLAQLIMVSLWLCQNNLHEIYNPNARHCDAIYCSKHFALSQAL